MNQQKEKNVGVIYVGEDLDVLIQLCDRILVLCGGKVSGIVDARKVTKEQIGLLMTKMPDEVKVYEYPKSEFLSEELDTEDKAEERVEEEMPKEETND